MVAPNGGDDDFGGFSGASSAAGAAGGIAPGGAQAIPSGAALFADDTPTNNAPTPSSTLLSELQQSLQAASSEPREKKPSEKASIADIKSMLSHVVAATPAPAPASVTPPSDFAISVTPPTPGLGPFPISAPSRPMEMLGLVSVPPVVHQPSAHPQIFPNASPSTAPTASQTDEEWGSWDTGASTTASPRTAEAFTSFAAAAAPAFDPIAPKIPLSHAAAPAPSGLAWDPHPIPPAPIVVSVPTVPATTIPPTLLSLNSMTVGASLFSSEPEPVEQAPEPEPAPPLPSLPVAATNPLELAAQSAVQNGGIAPVLGNGLGPIEPPFASPPAPMVTISVTSAMEPTPSKSDDDWAEFSSASTSPPSGLSPDATGEFGGFVAIPSASLSPVPLDFFTSSTGSLNNSQLGASTEVVHPAASLLPSSTPPVERLSAKEDDWAAFSPAAATTQPVTRPDFAPPIASPVASPSKSTLPQRNSLGPMSDADLFAVLAAKSAPTSAPPPLAAPADLLGLPFDTVFSTPKPQVSGPSGAAVGMDFGHFSSPVVATASSVAPSRSGDLFSVPAPAQPAAPAPMTPVKIKAAGPVETPNSVPAAATSWIAQQAPKPAPAVERPKTPSKDSGKNAAPLAASKPTATAPLPASAPAPSLGVWEVDIKTISEAIDVPTVKSVTASGAKVASVLKTQAAPPKASEQEFALVARWQASLVMVLRELKRAESFFANIKQTISHQTPNDVEEFIDIAKRLLHEERIMDYIQGVVEVYKVSDRIQDCFFMNPPQFSLLESSAMPSLSASLSSINAAWKALISCLDALVGKGHKLLDLPRAVDDTKKGAGKPANGEESKLRCAVCAAKLLRTEPVVKFGGKWCHSSCGNFWIHRVRPDVAEAL